MGHRREAAQAFQALWTGSQILRLELLALRHVRHAARLRRRSLRASPRVHIHNGLGHDGDRLALHPPAAFQVARPLSTINPKFYGALSWSSKARAARSRSASSSCATQTTTPHAPSSMPTRRSRAINTYAAGTSGPKAISRARPRRRFAKTKFSK